MTERGTRKTLAGTVISNKMEKTVLVVVERLTRHRAYGKFIRRRAKYMVHDPKNNCQIGDQVRIVESRPMSRRKRWQVVQVLSHANIED